MAFDIQGLLARLMGQGAQSQPANMLVQPNAQPESMAPQNQLAAAAQPQMAQAAPMQAPVDPIQTGATPQAPGLMDKFKAFQSSDAGGRLNDMFTGWAMGATPQDSIGKGAFMVSQGNQTRKGKAAQNQTVEWLKSQGMDEGQAKLISSNPPVLSEFLKSRLTKTQPIEINGQLVDPTTHEVVGDYRTPDKDANKPQVVSKGGMIYENGEWKTPPVGAGGASQVDFGDIAGVRKEVQGLPSYKNLAQAAPIWESMVNTSKNDSKASDLNLVYGLGKIFDPNSVVREGEMVMVKDTAGLSDQVLGWINAVNGGARLTPEVRKAIMQEAQNRVKSYDTMFQGDAQQYQGIADRYGIKREDVLPNLPKIQGMPEMGAAPTPQQGAAPAAGQVMDGYRFKGGNPADPNAWEKQ